MVKTSEKTEKDEYQKAGKTFPPFVGLEVGQTLKAVVEEIREKIEEEKVKGKIIKRSRILFDLRLETECEVAVGSVRKKTRKNVKMAADSLVCLQMDGNQRGLWVDMVSQITGEVLTLPEDDDLTPEMLKPVEGRKILINRLVDGKMSKGRFAGNPVKSYELLYK